MKFFRNIRTEIAVKNLLLTVLFGLLVLTAAGQTRKKEKVISRSGKELVKALKKNDAKSLAKNYEDLGNKLISKHDYAKGEIYLKKALSEYRKLKRSNDVARVSRSLAKVQEKQNKTKEAVANYSVASEEEKGVDQKQMNLSDANRLVSNTSYASDQSDKSLSYSDENISLFKKNKMPEELQDAYEQKIQTLLFQNKHNEAIEVCKQAISDAGKKTERMYYWKGRIADIYRMSGHFSKALADRNTLLFEAENKQDTTLQITQLKAISVIYFEKEDAENGIYYLKKAYKLALAAHQSAAVKDCLSRLVDYYREINAPAESLVLYDEFLRNFDRLVKSDSSLVDMATFQLIEGKIEQLEKEKKLKDRLIEKTNTFNYFLLGSLLVLLILLLLFIRLVVSIKRKNKRIALQSLRREMNPHFLFNSLNSVNQFIAQNNELEANKYLTSYSNLMRATMENSGKDFILMSKEVELLRKYLDLELMRFNGKFDFEIHVDEKLDSESVFLPNMLIQPHLENAIWHGLRYLDHKGLLRLSFEKENSTVRILIDDNGIGISKSSELKTQNQKKYESVGLKNISERIELLNSLYKQQITLKITEKDAAEHGTRIELVVPLLIKLPE